MINEALTVRGINPEVDRQVAYSLVTAGYTIRFILDLLLDGEEIHELLALAVQELAVL